MLNSKILAAIAFAVAVNAGPCKPPPQKAVGSIPDWTDPSKSSSSSTKGWARTTTATATTVDWADPTTTGDLADATTTSDWSDPTTTVQGWPTTTDGADWSDPTDVISWSTTPTSSADPTWSDWTGPYSSSSTASSSSSTPSSYSYTFGTSSSFAFPTSFSTSTGSFSTPSSHSFSFPTPFSTSSFSTPTSYSFSFPTSFSTSFLTSFSFPTSYSTSFSTTSSYSFSFPTTFSTFSTSSSSSASTSTPTSTSSTSSVLSTVSTTSASSTSASTTTPATTTSTTATTTTTTTSTTTTTITTTTAATTTTSTTTTGEPSVTGTAVVTGAAAVTVVNDNDGLTTQTDHYTFYQGDGSAAQGWPTIAQWESFDAMWTANLPNIGQNCAFGSGANAYTATSNTPDETQQIRDAIEAVAAKSLLDHRFILAVILQESHGCVRVGTTTSPDGTVRNPGIMQDHNGSGTCDDSANGSAQVNPCPVTEIFQMVEDGSQGTASGDGLVQTVNESEAAGTTDGQTFYQAARRYNSGSVPADGNLGEAPGATLCYASDIANRLTGWVNVASTCTL